MADGTTKLQSLIEQLEQATEAAREVIRELHGMHKDSKKIMADLEEQCRNVAVMANTKAEEIGTKAIEMEVEKLKPRIMEAVEKTERTIEKRFNQLERIFLDEPSSNGTPGISQIALAVGTFRQLERSDPRFRQRP